MPHTCPRCGAELVPRTFGVTRVEGCNTCGGQWFEGGVLSRLARDPAAPLNDIARAFRRALAFSDDEGLMQCPGCGIPLAGHTFPACPDLPLDVCRTCKGIWLDYGKLELIAVSVAHGRAAAAPPAAGAAAHGEPAAGGAEFLRCQRCGSGNPGTVVRCWSCGAELHASGERRRPCPQCAVPLHSIVEDDTRYELCAECSGIWLEDGRLSVFLQLEPETCANVMARIEAEHAEAVRAMEEAREASEHSRPHPLSANHSAKPAHGPHRTPAEPQPEAEPGPHNYRCPSCRFEMHAHLYGQYDVVTVHVCGGCRSTWLGDGQLRAAYELVRREGFLSVRGGAESEVWARD